MQIINLTHGAGNGVDKACLITASNMLIGRSEDGDNNSCVCKLLQDFIILTNDKMPIPLLRKLYSPLVWEILGTRIDDEKILRQRIYCFTDWAVREIMPINLKLINLEKEALKLENILPITNKKTALTAHKITTEVCDIIANRIKCNSDISKHAISPIRYAHSAARCSLYNIIYANSAVNYVAQTASAAASVTDFGLANAEQIWHKCPEIIRKVASIGDKRPVETVISIDQLRECLV